ncbi:MAG: DUF1318 domain-containing protein [Bacteriovoracia bacterium]
MKKIANALIPTSERGVSVGAVVMIAALAVAAGCVTVNVNFPESAVQKATDDYVRELYRSKKKDKEGETPAVKPTGTSYFSLIPQAVAEDFSFNLDSPKAAQIKDKLAAQAEDVLKYKRAGILGESQAGLLVVRGDKKADGKALSPIEKKAVEKIVSNENELRRELYAEVLKSNNLPDTRKVNIEKSFSRSFQSMSPSNTWLQNESGWEQKQ